MHACNSLWRLEEHGAVGLIFTPRVTPTARFEARTMHNVVIAPSFTFELLLEQKFVQFNSSRQFNSSSEGGSQGGNTAAFLSSFYTMLCA